MNPDKGQGHPRCDRLSSMTRKANLVIKAANYACNDLTVAMAANKER